ncbi:hypothetical protein HVTV-2_gp30 [Haloarcula virus HVTV-2]|uniref:Uncharacterized protein n=1 Tax=Haloarcula vallismortis tailed virus 1 TaxID=1262528 RepID=L7TK92_9CAUD|nr:hypothetical protein HVTV1_30 [Haloarcula vallismortis tailed virus 1]AGC34400.1 hypothetical protein HVTV1_30 [Haloarcula vallismortis tailed virus 1]UBF22837.1 hypothetical protein HVTV-2_gp30 [Haloarcula virus HVTV-2]
MTEYDRAGRFNLDADNGDRVCLCYVASTSGTIQQVVGEVTDYGNLTEFTEVTEDETGDVYRMCGTGLADRELGEVMRDGRKVGEFDSAWEVSSR